MRTLVDEEIVGLVGDIGGTNARFALARRKDGQTTISDFLALECSDFVDVYVALTHYFTKIGIKPKLDYICLAVAGPLKDGEMRFTNLSWRVSEAGLIKATGARIARLINDYAGLAYSLPYLSGSDFHEIGSETRGHGQVYAVLGAGTGFGASVLIKQDQTTFCLSTESGHASFAPVNDFESEIVRYLRKKYGRVTIEMVLSGPGLVNLYQAITSIRGEVVEAVTPAQITDLAGPDAKGSRHTVDAFLDILASVCGDLALIQGATQGVFIAGGIAPRLIPHIDAKRFRARMEAKAPMVHFVDTLPCRIITHDYAALLGSANALTDQLIKA